MEFLDLTLCTNNKISLRKKPLEVSISGGIPLKIKSFLVVQIVQHIRITANMKNWDWEFGFEVVNNFRDGPVGEYPD